MAEIKGIHHVGVASPDGEKMVEFFTENLGAEFVKKEVFPEQNQTSYNVKVGECELEIMEPLGEEGAAAGFIAKKGPGLHHISIQVTGIVELAEELEAKGIKVIGKQFEDPSVYYMFISPKSTGGVLIEIFERF